MKKKYRVCLIMPKGYVHSQVFFETALLLKNSILETGIDCDIQLNQFAEDRLNILLGYHLLKFSEELLRYSYVVYQFEQLEQLRKNLIKTRISFENLLKILNEATEIWDYSHENINFLETMDIKARYLPVGYHPCLELIPYSEEKDIDVFFYGSIDERRKNILKQFKKSTDIVCQYAFGIYGKERDDRIGRSKIILNIHKGESDQFEPVRVSYLLNNRCFVISEPSSCYPYRGVDLCFVKREEIVERCRYFLSHQEEIHQKREETYQQFKKNYPMTDMIRKFL